MVEARLTKEVIALLIREAFSEGFEEGHASAAAEAALWEGWDESGAWAASESKVKVSQLTYGVKDGSH